MGIKARKKFAQHWLKSETALNNIILASQLKSSDKILEIGPGTGILTDRLLPHINKLLAIEIDQKLCKLLVKKYGDLDNFLLLEGDFLELNLDSILTDKLADFADYNKVVANIPYNITGPILEKLLGKISKPSTHFLESIVLLVQKEVAQRLTAIPNNKDYGALTLRVQYLADCKIVCDVPARDFYPRPKVDSAVVKLTPRKLAQPADNPNFLDSLIKLGFSSRRKMLKNNLKSIIESEKLADLLVKLELNPLTRAENLSLENWILLSNKLNEIN